MASVALVWLGQPISGLLGLEHSVHDLRFVVGRLADLCRHSGALELRLAWREGFSCLSSSILSAKRTFIVTAMTTNTMATEAAVGTNI